MKTMSVTDIRALIRGEVITPEDSGYDEGRALFYGGMDHRPAVIIRPSDAEDVARVVTLARETGQDLAIRSGGHSMAGHSVPQGGIMLDLRNMRSLEIDVENRTAWAEAGLTAGEFTEATGKHGLVTGFGDTGSVGIGGITLGGGVGFLVRKYGLTIDNLLAAEVVTAGGQILHTDSQTNPDLFWAIRGGGGNFGVVTRFQFRLHKLPEIVGGILILPATPQVITGFLSAADAAPEELSTIVNVMPAPPMPFVPADQHGKLIVMAMMVYAGGAEAGQRAIAPFRALAQPIADMVKPMQYAEMFPPEEGGYHPTAAAHTMFVNHIEQAQAEAILNCLQESDAPMRVAQLRILGGAAARIPADATAYAHRDAKIMVNIAAFYSSPEERLVREAWIADFASTLNQGDSRAYVNFLGNESEARVRAAYPNGAWERLAAIKARYDPTNLFHLNQNIPPAGK